jgi:hypothetical protein
MTSSMDVASLDDCRDGPPEPERYGRSKITNGTQLIPGVDQRSAWVRRAKDLIREYLADLGGFDNVSAAERSIVRRCACLTVELERLEQRFATAGEASADALDLYGRTSSTLRRLHEAVGLQRRPRDVTTDSASARIASYLDEAAP